MTAGCTRLVCWTVALAAGVAQPAAAQVGGTVVDTDTGVPVAGAHVTARAGGRRATTGAAGEFAFDAEQVGTALPLRVVVAAVGYYSQNFLLPASLDGGVTELGLEAVPTVDSAEFEFPPADGCKGCHPTAQEDWEASAMARAGGNSWVHDIYNGDGTPTGDGGFVYTRDSSFRDSNPNSECAACHQPERWSGQPGAALSTDADLPGVAHGISCSVCHRMAKFDVTKANFPGLVPEAVTMTRPAPADGKVVVQYGPLDDVDYINTAVMRPSYQPQIRSEFCAACHQDKNDPDEDGDFEQPNGVVSEPTYQEWAESDYGDPDSPTFRSCAGCHMEVLDAPAACDEVDLDPPRPLGEVRRHTFEGTTPKFLDNAVTMTLSAGVDDASAPGSIDVELSIHNDRTGHHVPTGVTIRNMIAVVEARSVASGESLLHTGEQLVHDLGGVGDPAAGYFAGLPGKLYAKVNHGSDGKGPVFFSEATGITFDSRIPALATDTTHYSFRPPAGGGEVEVRARLIYRRSWRALLDAKGWTLDGHGAPLQDVQAPHYGHLMAEATATVTLASASTADAGLDAGGPAAADAGGRPDPNANDGDAPHRDAGDGAADADGDGACGCRTVGAGGGGSGPGVALTLLLASARHLHLRRRRRRRRRARTGQQKTAPPGTRVAPLPPLGWVLLVACGFGCADGWKRVPTDAGADRGNADAGDARDRGHGGAQMDAGPWDGATGSGASDAGDGVPVTPDDCPASPELSLQLPEALACTGLYADVASKVLGAGMRPFKPAVEQWSDGATMARWLYLPPDTKIDASDPDNWRLPIGSRLFQELTWKGQRAETRVFWKVSQGTMLKGSYHWAPDGRSASRSPGGEVRVGGEPYQIPSAKMCDQCHKARNDRALGIEAVLLGLPGATGLTLGSLVADGLLEHHEGPTALRVGDDGTGLAGRALPWLHTNCGVSCHNAAKWAEANRTGLFMRMSPGALNGEPSAHFDSRTTSIGLVSTAGRWGEMMRIEPGLAQESLLYYLLSTRDPAKRKDRMPPVASAIIPAEGAALIAAWIDAMPREDPGDAGIQDDDAGE